MVLATCINTPAALAFNPAAYAVHLSPLKTEPYLSYSQTYLKQPTGCVVAIETMAAGPIRWVRSNVKWRKLLTRHSVPWKNVSPTCLLGLTIGTQHPLHDCLQLSEGPVQNIVGQQKVWLNYPRNLCSNTLGPGNFISRRDWSCKPRYYWLLQLPQVQWGSLQTEVIKATENIKRIREEICGL